MHSTGTQRATYASGHSPRKLQRLQRQAQAFEPFTRQLFQQSGIVPGMRVLNVGCGSGDVAFLAADLVGPSGEVVGADRNSSAVPWANTRAQFRSMSNIRFLDGDPAALDFDEPFDAVVGRFALMAYLDPVVALRQLLRHLCPGGVMVFQEFDFANCRSQPSSPTYERIVSLIQQTLRATAARPQVGLELHRVFHDAGLPAPSLRIDSLVGAGPDSPACAVVADVFQSLLPAMEKLHIATAAELDPSFLEQRLKHEITASKGVVVSPALIGACSRKPA
jgi:SAM-dependent methyltransferase